MRTQGVIDESSVFDFTKPVADIDATDEKRMLSIAGTDQWAELKAKLLQKREAYSQQLPGGLKYKYMTKDDAAYFGSIADCVIEEIDSIILLVEGLQDAVRK